MNLIFYALWFFLPAGAANVTPIIAAKTRGIKKFTYPLDFHKKLRGRAILGNHKTWRGLITGVLFAVITAFAQQYLYIHVPFFRLFTQIDYARLNPLFIGVLQGFGALGGDSLKSFIKRQISIKPGDSWFPFDQTDYILFSIVLSYTYIHLSLLQNVLSVFIWFFISLGASGIGFILRLKKQPM